MDQDEVRFVYQGLLDSVCKRLDQYIGKDNDPVFEKFAKSVFNPNTEYWKQLGIATEKDAVLYWLANVGPLDTSEKNLKEMCKVVRLHLNSLLKEMSDGCLPMHWTKVHNSLDVRVSSNNNNVKMDLFAERDNKMPTIEIQGQEADADIHLERYLAELHAVMSYKMTGKRRNATKEVNIYDTSKPHPDDLLSALPVEILEIILGYFNTTFGPLALVAATNRLSKNLSNALFKSPSYATAQSIIFISNIVSKCAFNERLRLDVCMPIAMDSVSLEMTKIGLKDGHILLRQALFNLINDNTLEAYKTYLSVMDSPVPQDPAIRPQHLMSIRISVSTMFSHFNFETGHRLATITNAILAPNTNIAPYINTIDMVMNIIHSLIDIFYTMKIPLISANVIEADYVSNVPLVYIKMGDRIPQFIQRLNVRLIGKKLRTGLKVGSLHYVFNADLLGPHGQYRSPSKIPVLTSTFLSEKEVTELNLMNRVLPTTVLRTVYTRITQQNAQWTFVTKLTAVNLFMLQKFNKKFNSPWNINYYGKLPPFGKLNPDQRPIRLIMGDQSIIVNSVISHSIFEVLSITNQTNIIFATKDALRFLDDAEESNGSADMRAFNIFTNIVLALSDVIAVRVVHGHSRYNIFKNYLTIVEESGTINFIEGLKNALKPIEEDATEFNKMYNDLTAKEKATYGAINVYTDLKTGKTVYNFNKTSSIKMYSIIRFLMVFVPDATFWLQINFLRAGQETWLDRPLQIRKRNDYGEIIDVDLPHQLFKSYYIYTGMNDNNFVELFASSALNRKAILDFAKDEKNKRMIMLLATSPSINYHVDQPDSVLSFFEENTFPRLFRMSTDRFEIAKTNDSYKPYLVSTFSSNMVPKKLYINRQERDTLDLITEPGRYKTTPLMSPSIWNTLECAPLEFAVEAFKLFGGKPGKFYPEHLALNNNNA